MTCSGQSLVPTIC